MAYNKDKAINQILESLFCMALLRTLKIDDVSKVLKEFKILRDKRFREDKNES